MRGGEECGNRGEEGLEGERAMRKKEKGEHCPPEKISERRERKRESGGRKAIRKQEEEDFEKRGRKGGGATLVWLFASSPLYSLFSVYHSMWVIKSCHFHTEPDKRLQGNIFSVKRTINPPCSPTYSCHPPVILFSWRFSKPVLLPDSENKGENWNVSFDWRIVCSRTFYFSILVF